MSKVNDIYQKSVIKNIVNNAVNGTGAGKHVDAKYENEEAYEDALAEGITVPQYELKEIWSTGGPAPARLIKTKKVFKGFVTVQKIKRNSQGGGNYLGNVDLGNGNVVNVYFANTKDGVNSNLSVNSSLVKAFNGAVIAASQSHTINSITISATTNGVHGSNSRHYAGNALDISMVNGVAVGPNQPVIGALQNAFENQAGRRENFGPALMMKLGQPYLNDNLPTSLYRQRLQIRNAHYNHIHWSVD